MKILGILGSPRGIRGNTGRLINELMGEAKKKGAGTEIIEIVKFQINHCQGCDKCRKLGSCQQEDDFSSIRDKILQADGLVWGSPVYAFQVTGQTKTLIDRLCSVGHYFPFSGKYCATISVAGGVGEEEVIKYLNSFIIRFGGFVVGQVGAKAVDPGEFINKDQAFGEAAALGRRLIEAIKEKKTYPLQTEERKHLQDALKEVIQSKKDTWQAEYKYWKERGWL